jgi:dTDP-4-amino-4,6-dideoxygalactose transaminase
VATRRELAAHYHKRLDGCPHVTTPVVRDGCEHSYHLYVIRSSARDALMAKLTALKIPVALHYPAAIHQQPGYARHASASSGLPQTNSAVSEIMSLPMHPYLTTTAIEAVCDGIMSFTP